MVAEGRGRWNVLFVQGFGASRGSQKVESKFASPFQSHSEQMQMIQASFKVFRTGVPLTGEPCAAPIVRWEVFPHLF